MLDLPLLPFSFKVLRQLLIPVHLHEHLLLEALLQLLRLLAVALFEVLDVFPQTHLHLRLLLSKNLELAPLRLDLLAVLLLQLRHLLLVVAVAVPELEVDAARQLLDLPLQVQQGGLLVVEECLRHQNLVGETEGALLVALGGHLLLHLKDDKAAVVSSTEEVLLVVGDPDAGHGLAVRLILDVVAIKREVVATQWPWQIRLGDSREKGTSLACEG
mmetsp:Transcript_83035/g.225505  ORF Transcript_83035/g.225505 Transcript_83035/m.225505 type:complete len:216 (+) Transcript_83035:1545-2192(+)